MSESKPKTINGNSFEISQPYAEGHVLTAIEARVLNQTRAENVGNNVRAKLKEMEEAGKSLAELAAHVAEVDAAYTFTAANARAAAKLDPYEKEAQKLARGLLRDHLASTGRHLTKAPDGVSEEDWVEKIASEVDRIASNEDIVKAAKAAVDARAKRADKMQEALSGVSI